jgi:hypothetical protein
MWARPSRSGRPPRRRGVVLAWRAPANAKGCVGLRDGFWVRAGLVVGLRAGLVAGFRRGVRGPGCVCQCCQRWSQAAWRRRRRPLRSQTPPQVGGLRARGSGPARVAVTGGAGEHHQVRMHRCAGGSGRLGCTSRTRFVQRGRSGGDGPERVSRRSWRGGRFAAPPMSRPRWSDQGKRPTPAGRCLDPRLDFCVDRCLDLCLDPCLDCKSDLLNAVDMGRFVPHVPCGFGAVSSRVHTRARVRS